jgi:hypothetical protein
MKPTSGADTDDCDWYHLATTTNDLDYTFDNSTECGRILDSVINPESSIDPYNFFQDCYASDASSFQSQLKLNSRARRDPAVSFLVFVEYLSGFKGSSSLFL